MISIFVNEYYYFIISNYIICFWFEKYSSLRAKKFLDEFETKECKFKTNKNESN